MSEIVVEGGRKLIGEVPISGSKNAALPILAAAVMIDEPVVLDNVPELKDVFTMLTILQRIGKKVSFRDNRVVVEPGNVLMGDVPYELVRMMRASFNVLGPLTMVCGWAKVGKPGGCNIGQRPVDFHIEGLKALGFLIKEEHGDVIAKKPSSFKEELYYKLPFPSVGATEQLMTVAALMSESKTIIENVAREPEIQDLQNFLNKAGAKIKGAGTDRIEIEGVEKLHGIEYHIIPDRIEAGTYLLAGVSTRGRVKVSNVIPEHLEALLKVLDELGVSITCDKNSIEVSVSGELKPIRVSTAPYPGFPTDLQPMLTAVLCTVPGESIIEEKVFENRFGYVDEMNRMSANIKVMNRVAHIVGVEKLSGAQIYAPDIRATAGMLIAALSAEGQTVIKNAAHIFRGYEKLKEKFTAIGAQIEIYPEE
ncbi:UDP-N-acetylglucosamine 1-carboxyvinyltransferase [Kosmotoga sp.]|uniref:UDP-N-acetylglucosamine 1-carboxyvinyltransferase n=1 Tax=Kosmotoga sp. TaxID=1955248 RepID=UPI0024AB46E1|nr:UDP-N-acetylglucosamine 1-carboxyvinyltransferase [Kosmotoga sp.]MDI3523428.1 UDP-N-acetylglucosamine 1-carboxyvinyltransferase [Kosmotoga sp.]MDK2952926.1 UDP-N-acetylglucosamine 1-carboxyvinyltransferase [Kosmotoga sp.]